MKTKLVYVLTCAPEGTYIEQAYISIYSARYHNPDAHIVLILDESTNKLLVGHRADMLEYITEKIIVNAPTDFTPMQASRWLKSSVRNIIDGDYLFIDCDTIVTSSLSEVDSFDCEIGAVLDCHLHVFDFPYIEKKILLERSLLCGWDFNDLTNYYSSGILFVKDTPQTRVFFYDWHKNWMLTNSKSICIDQISLAQTNIKNNLIQEIDGIWNCIMFTRPSFVNQAKIIHFPSLDNNSFLFSRRVLERIKLEGLSNYITKYILNPTHSFFPYLKTDFNFCNFFHSLRWVKKSVKEYGNEIDSSYQDLMIKSKIGPIIISLYRRKVYSIPTFMWMLWIVYKRKYILSEYK